MAIYLITLVFIQVLFGANFVVSKIVVGKMDPVYFAGIRFIISGLTLYLFQLARGHSLKIKANLLWLLFFISLFGIGLGQSLFMLGLEKTTAINTSLISSTIPIFVFIINKVRKISDWNFVKVMGLLISFFGVLVLRNVENFDLNEIGIQGDLLVLAACFCLGLSISYSKDLFVSTPAISGSAHMFLLGGLSLLPWMFFRELGETSAMLDTSFLTPFFFAIFGATCLTYLLNNWVLGKIDSSIVGLFIFLQPVIAALFAMFFLGEPITLRMVISFLLILTGVFFVVAPKMYFEKN
jgi:drug/metabolite transporter (DMT)-like permease